MPLFLSSRFNLDFIFKSPSFAFTFTKLISQFSFTFTSLLYARELGPSLYGKISFCLIWVNLCFVLLNTFSSPAVILIFQKKSLQYRDLFNYFVPLSSLNFVIGTILLLSLQGLLSSEQNTLYYLISSFWYLSNISNVVEILLVYHNHVRLAILSTLFSVLTLFILRLIGILFGFVSPETFLLTRAIAEFSKLTALLLFSHFYISQALPSLNTLMQALQYLYTFISKVLFKHIFTYFTFSICVILTLFLNSLDKLFITFLVGDESLGNYSVFNSAWLTLSIIPVSVSSIAIKSFVDKANSFSLKIYYSKSLIVSLVSICLYLLGSFCIYYILGSSFSEGYFASLVLLLATPFSVLASFNARLYEQSGLSHLLALKTLFAICLSLFFTPVLINSFGISGASISVVISYVCLAWRPSKAITVLSSVRF